MAAEWVWNADGHTAAQHAAIKKAADQEFAALKSQWVASNPIRALETPYPTKSWLSNKPRPALDEMYRHGHYRKFDDISTKLAHVAIIGGGGAILGAAALAGAGAIGAAGAGGGLPSLGGVFPAIGEGITGIAGSVGSLAGSIGSVAGTVGTTLGTVGSVVGAGSGILDKIAGGHSGEMSPVSDAAMPESSAAPAAATASMAGAILPVVVVLLVGMLLSKRK